MVSLFKMFLYAFVGFGGFLLALFLFVVATYKLFWKE